MLNPKTVNYVLIILGGVILVISLAADFLGIGQFPSAIGWKQWLGAAFGLILVLGGVGLTLWGPPEKG